jgi:hypothetical protein
MTSDNTQQLAMLHAARKESEELLRKSESENRMLLAKVEKLSFDRKTFIQRCENVVQQNTEKDTQIRGLQKEISEDTTLFDTLEEMKENYIRIVTQMKASKDHDATKIKDLEDTVRSQNFMNGRKSFTATENQIREDIIGLLAQQKMLQDDIKKLEKKEREGDVVSPGGTLSGPDDPEVVSHRNASPVSFDPEAAAVVSDGFDAEAAEVVSDGFDPEAAEKIDTDSEQAEAARHGRQASALDEDHATLQMITSNATIHSGRRAWDQQENNATQSTAKSGHSGQKTRGRSNSTERMGMGAPRKPLEGDDLKVVSYTPSPPNNSKSRSNS